MALNGDNSARANVKEGVVLSQGAAVALGNALSRVIPSTGLESSKKSVKQKGKRPRPSTDTTGSNKPIVLAENEDVLKEISEEREQKRRQKEHKKKKLQFEQNARVVPDAATGAALEKTFLTIATKGTVALFNAVSKAQKVSNVKKSSMKQKGPAISKKAFMEMMKENIEKTNTAPLQATIKDQSDTDSETKKPTRLKAKWLKEDYLISKDKKLKDWDRAEVEAESSEAESEDPNDSASPSGDDELVPDEEVEDELEEDDVLSEEESEIEEEYE